MMEKVKSLGMVVVFFMLCGVVSPMNDEGSLLFIRVILNHKVSILG